MKTRLLGALLLASCATQEVAKKAEPVVAEVKPELKKLVLDMTKPMPAGLDEAAMDFTADPCNDFYQYACGGWMAKNEIPPEKPVFSRGFVSIADRNEQNLKTILEEAAANKLPANTPFAKQLGDYYASCMDLEGLERSLPEVKKFAAQVTNFKNASELAKVLGLAHQSGVHALFAIGSTQDLKNSAEVIAGMSQGGISLPDRDLYVQDDERSQKIREAYQAYLLKMFTLYGENAADAKKSADAVFALETRLAKASLTRVEMRDPQKLYNRIDRAGLKEKAPNFNWDTYFTALGAKDLKSINVSSVAFLAEVSAIAKDVKPEALKPYLTWFVIRSSVAGLPKAFQDEAFAFASKNFSGAKEDRPRWKKCVAFSDGDLGEALGREYARRFFPEESKQRTNAMVQALQTAFEKNLETLPWMDAATREAALTKVHRMVSNNKIGYTDKWRDYSALKTDRTKFLANSVAANRFEFARDMAKIGKPVDRTEWLMSAPTVNAYYEPQKNEIVFPAGILQPPFFNKEATDAVNFGAMGMVVGHELTHGFDDEGRQFDVDGNLKDWWSADSAKQFEERVACVEKQYDGYTAIEDLKLKGKLTLGENVADLGGLKLAYAAMTDWYAKKGTNDAANSRFTLPQQFFLGMAQSWCTKMRPEQARIRVMTDPHSPPMWRVNGPNSNLDAFKAAFECSEGKMVRTGAARCSVW